MKQIDATSRLDSELLRSFLAIARSGSITRAAQILNRTQSAVSVQIKRLESKLGEELFERQARGVKLTPAGERLLGKASQILALLDTLAMEFRSGAVEGPVAVGIPEEYGGTKLPAILGEFARAHPAAQVSVQCGFSTGFHAAVAQGELDLAVYLNSPQDTAGEFLMAEETVWAASRGLPVSPDTTLPLVLFDRSCWWRDAAIAALEQAGRSYRIAFTSESVAGVRAAVAAGLGVAVLARGSLGPEMRALTPADGLPALAPSRLVLLTGPRAAAPPVAAMATAIRASFRG
ncbi:MAG TPA: LysR substrate-binding domain-containing protein [Aestuariivirgaceae bacterium]|nr:LysR substrate-binding domain-containing protein [Aestuariivirgaceae bacterium]